MTRMTRGYWMGCPGLLGRYTRQHRFTLIELSFGSSFIAILAALLLLSGLLVGCDKPNDPIQTKLQETKAKADEGDAVAQCDLGFMYIDGQGVTKDYAEAAKWLRKAADQNNALAQYNLGAAYASGSGVVKDETEALKWFRKAAEQNNADAQHNLGVIYAQGTIVPQNLAEALKWLRKAAEQNNPDAQSKLALMYALGQGTARDPIQAHAWWNIAAGNGDPDARSNIDKLEKEMTPQQMNQAVHLAREIAPGLKKK
jgi:TPR repeat protein